MTLEKVLSISISPRRTRTFISRIFRCRHLDPALKLLLAQAHTKREAGRKPAVCCSPILSPPRFHSYVNAPLLLYLQRGPPSPTKSSPDTSVGRCEKRGKREEGALALGGLLRRNATKGYLLVSSALLLPSRLHLKRLHITLLH